MSDRLSIVYDLELYPNCFTIAAEHADYPMTWQFEISDYRNDAVEIIQWLYWIKKNSGRLVGYNNVGFDYPVLHLLIQSNGKATAGELYTKAMQIIQAQDDNRLAHMVYPSDRFVEQLDLFKIWHFDNRARSTSLKVLEFNMRMDNVSDLPFPVGSMLNQEQIKLLKEYNAHDVRATKRFYHESMDLIHFREQLTAKHGRDFMNHSDVKIGTEIFQMELEKAGVQCYTYGKSGREPKQTKRDVIRLADAILPWIKLESPEFNRIHQWMLQQTISETKGVFEDVTARCFGLEFVFGTGGLHAAVTNQTIEARDDLVIESRDVSSYYPNLAISNRFYPEHLGEKFCDVYAALYTQRKSYPKGTAENAALKLALNGSFGKANDKFSIFYDPLFLLKITLNGQLLLCMLIEQLVKIPSLQMLMSNTDGLEYSIHPDHVAQANAVCKWWCDLTKLELEGSRYSKLCIADVNNYIGIYEND